MLKILRKCTCEELEEVTLQSRAWMTKILSTTPTEIFTALSKNKANLEKDTTLVLIYILSKNLTAKLL